jgi:hypothetical protein
MSVSRKIGAGFFLVGFLSMGWALTAESPFKGEISYRYESEVDREPVLSMENLSADHDSKALEEAIDMKAQGYVQGYIPEPDYGIVPNRPSAVGCEMGSLRSSIYVEKDATVHHIQVKEPAWCHSPHTGRIRYNLGALAGSLAFVLGIISIGIGKTTKKLKDKKKVKRSNVKSTK